MTGMGEAFDVTVSEMTFRVSYEPDGEDIRICIFSDGRLRFSLPEGTPPEQVRKFIQVYALGFSDGKSAVGTTEDRIRGRLQDVARKLGRATAGWKSG